MSAITAMPIRPATMEFAGKKNQPFYGVPAKVRIGDHVFTSPVPLGAGDAQSINRDIEVLVETIRKAS